MIERRAAGFLRRCARHYPVVTITGPRQAGKSTLCVSVFPDLPRVSFEPVDVREYASSDPRSFLRDYPDGAIFDEVQHVPGLLSYLQELVDADPRPGRFILTGSQNLALTAAVSQSLAGRTAVLELLPLSLDEVRLFPGAGQSLWPLVWAGGYPRIYDRDIPAGQWIADYVTTYVQRDVRAIQNIQDLTAFTTFLKLAAARTGQELNLSDLGADAGVSQPTAKGWLAVLEASYLCHRVPAWTRNLRKQLVKAPKLHFVDTGLVCWLLGIRDPNQLRLHPLRGAIFESWVAAEVLKARRNQGLPAQLFHYRQTRGAEIDLLIERAADDLIAVECKSGATVQAEFFAHLTAFEAPGVGPLPAKVERRLVYGGDVSQRRTAADVVSWSAVQDSAWG